MTPLSRELLPADILNWIERSLGGEIVRIKPRAGGGAVRSGAEVDVASGGGLVLCFLAYDSGNRGIANVRSKYIREASILQALWSTEIRAPRLLASDPDLGAHLFEFVDGEDRFAHVKDQRAALRVAKDFVSDLAKLHRLDAATLSLAGFGEIRPPAEYVGIKIERMAAEHIEAGPADPLIVYGLRWLLRNVPCYAGPTVIVHGDAGPGNFLFADDKVTAVLDWELCHYGDPLEDFAWMSIRAIIQAWVPLPPLFKAYERLSGIAVDLDRIRFYRVYTLLGMIIRSHRRFEHQPEALAKQGRLGAGLMFAMVHRRAYVHGLADALGLALPEVSLPEGEVSASAPYIRSLLMQVREQVVARTDDQVIAETAKDMARVLKYLLQEQQLGDALRRDELNDISKVLKTPFTDLHAARTRLVTRIKEDSIDDAAMIGLLWRRVQRETAVMRDAMGALADRLFPPLI